jgi:hypothetical protein
VKLYLAGPMRGLPDYNYPAFHEAARRLREVGYEVFNPAELDFPWDEAGSRAAMGAELAWICAQADAIALLDGYERSLGVAAEVATARALSLPVFRIGELVAPAVRSFR